GRAAAGCSRGCCPRSAAGATPRANAGGTVEDAGPGAGAVVARPAASAARAAPGLPARARALARGEPLAPGEVWAGKWARSAHAFWVAPEPAAAAAGS